MKKYNALMRLYTVDMTVVQFRAERSLYLYTVTKTSIFSNCHSFLIMVIKELTRLKNSDSHVIGVDNKVYSGIDIAFFC